MHRRRTSPTWRTRTTGSRASRRSPRCCYPAFTSNDPANTYLATGQAQWGSQFIPNINAFYTSKSPDNHYWFPPIANVSLIPNLTVPGLSNVAVRQAMAYAIDRNKVARSASTATSRAANQTGIVTPTFSAWMDTAAAAKYNYGYNPAKAKQILAQAGFTMGSDGIFATGGQAAVVHESSTSAATRTGSPRCR